MKQDRDLIIDGRKWFVDFLFIHKKWLDMPRRDEFKIKNGKDRIQARDHLYLYREVCSSVTAKVGRSYTSVQEKRYL